METDESLDKFATIEDEAEERAMIETDLEAGPIGEGFA